MSGLTHSTRNAVFTALFNLAKTIPPPLTYSAWKTTSQFLKQFDEVPAADQPALFLFRGPQHATQEKAFGVTKWKWRAFLWIYFRTEGYKTSSTYPDQFTDDFLDKLEQTFMPDPQNGVQNLGGLIHHCWIDGAIYFDSGLTDGQGVVVVPISILV